MKETFWQPMRFLDWVHHLRDYDIEDSIKELYTSEETWESYENTETFEDSLNNSRISINMTPVKKHLNESLQLSLDTSLLGTTLNNQTFNISKDQETINTCLLQIELAIKTIRKLCSKNSEIQSIPESLNNMESIICSLREILEIENISKCTNENVISIQNFNGSTIENSDINLTVSSLNCNIKSVSPTKSTLRNNDKSFVCDKKSVRFTDKLKEELT